MILYNQKSSESMNSQSTLFYGSKIWSLNVHLSVFCSPQSKSNSLLRTRIKSSRPSHATKNLIKKHFINAPAGTIGNILEILGANRQKVCNIGHTG